MLKLVAVAAILIWGGNELQRLTQRLNQTAAEYRNVAARYGASSRSYRGWQLARKKEAKKAAEQMANLSDDPDTPRLKWAEERLKSAQSAAVFAGRMADYQFALKLKYDRAAFYPWVTVEPDPEPPPDPQSK